jgi:hypothetical protein
MEDVVRCAGHGIRPEATVEDDMAMTSIDIPSSELGCFHTIEILPPHMLAYPCGLALEGTCRLLPGTSTVQILENAVEQRGSRVSLFFSPDARGGQGACHLHCRSDLPIVGSFSATSVAARGCHTVESHTTSVLQLGGGGGGYFDKLDADLRNMDMTSGGDDSFVRCKVFKLQAIRP